MKTYIILSIIVQSMLCSAMGPLRFGFIDFQQLPVCNAPGIDAHVVLRPRGGNPPYSYEVNGSANQDNSFMILSTEPGIYTFKVIDQDSTSIETTARLEPSVFSSGSIQMRTACDGTAIIDVDFTNGQSPMFFTLRNKNGSIIAGPTERNILEDIPVGAYELEVADSTEECLPLRIMFDVSVPEILLFTTETTPHNCKTGDLGSITVTVTGGTQPYIYSIPNREPQSDNVFTDLEVGIYSVTVNDADGCTITHDVAVRAQRAPMGNSLQDFINQKQCSLVPCS